MFLFFYFFLFLLFIPSIYSIICLSSQSINETNHYTHLIRYYTLQLIRKYITQLLISLFSGCGLLNGQRYNTHTEKNKKEKKKNTWS